MFGLDQTIASLGSGGAFLIVIAVALLLGLRHATDPDHLVAVSTLVASSDDRGARRALGLGLSWGLGHATTLILFGLPIVLFNDYLPEPAQRAAEVAVGLVIVALALRLLRRWRNGSFHVHTHSHERLEHRHLHTHGEGTGPRPGGSQHDHSQAQRIGRTPLQAFGIGLVHGMGGSAGVGVLLLAAIPDQVEGAIALTVFATFTAVSMSLASTTLGYALSRGPVLRRFRAVTPALGALSLAFGCWYALGAVAVLPYL
jgi:ABC-type nickel/cobalt efflux system permease component RcnA